MEKVFQWVSNKYLWVISKVPSQLLHLVICFFTALLSWEFALGLALGRESLSFSSADRIKDSLKDLLFDAIGIFLALAIKSIF